MEKEEIALENPVEIAGLTIVPVVQLILDFWHVKDKASFFGLKQPIAVIVVSPLAKRVFRITGEEVSLDQLLQEAPAIKERLERL